MRKTDAPPDYWAARDPKDYTQAQKDFIGWLEAAIKKSGGVTYLANTLTDRTAKKYNRRKIQYWLKGVGPSRPARNFILPVLIKIVREAAKK